MAIAIIMVCRLLVAWKDRPCFHSLGPILPKLLCPIRESLQFLRRNRRHRVFHHSFKVCAFDHGRLEFFRRNIPQTHALGSTFVACVIFSRFVAG